MKGTLAALCLLFSTTAPAQMRPSLATGRFLIADEGLADPNFSETVVLIVKRDPDGTMGLVVNRRSRITLARLLKEQGAAARTDVAFIGGPVGRTGILALVRSSEKLLDAQPVFGDVYMINTAADFDKAVKENTSSDRFRVYVGYAGWSAGQLERETDQGAWHTLRAEAPAVFDANPDTLWTRLYRQTQLRVARLVAPVHPGWRY